MARRSTKPYVHFARIYDQVMADVPYRLWMEYIASVWARYSFLPASVLDLACGTGSMSLLLARSGYLVTGLDASPAMLDVARQKLQAAGHHAEFVLADMRRFRLREPVDAAICVFDSLNYLLTPENVRMAFRSVFGALKPGGLLVFDANTPVRLGAIPKEVHLFEGADHYLIWSDLYDSHKQWWRVKLTGFIKSGAAGAERGGIERPDGEQASVERPAAGADDSAWLRFDETHYERAFPIEDTSAWLKAAGFEVPAVYDSCSFRPALATTSRAYFVARRPSPALSSG